MNKPNITNTQLWFAIMRLHALFEHQVREVQYIDSLFHKRLQNKEFIEWIHNLFRVIEKQVEDKHNDEAITYTEQDIYHYYYSIIRSQVNREYMQRVYNDNAVQSEIEWVKDVLFRSVDLAYMAFDENYQY